MLERKPTYEEIIQHLLESNPSKWFMSYELVSRWTTYKGKTVWLGPSADRIARYMAEEGTIERIGREDGGGKYAKYRAKQEVRQLSLV